MSELVLIDHLIFIWDENLFEKDSYYFMDLSEHALELMQFIEDNNIQIYMSEEIRETLLNVFPCSAISQQIPGVHFFVQRFFSFLTNNFNDSYLELCDISNITISPEPLRNPILHDHKDQFYRLFVNAVTGNLKKILSSELLWKNETEFRISIDNVEIGNLILLKSKIDWRWGIFRRYISSKKHDPFYGYGTINEYTEELNQYFVETAISLNEDEKVIYNFNSNEEQFLEYRFDNAGGYHGYPIPIIEVPASVMKFYTENGFIDKGKVRKYKKRKIT